MVSDLLELVKKALGFDLSCGHVESRRREVKRRGHLQHWLKESVISDRISPPPCDSDLLEKDEAYRIIMT